MTLHEITVSVGGGRELDWAGLMMLIAVVLGRLVCCYERAGKPAVCGRTAWWAWSLQSKTLLIESNGIKRSW